MFSFGPVDCSPPSSSCCVLRSVTKCGFSHRLLCSLVLACVQPLRGNKEVWVCIALGFSLASCVSSGLNHCIKKFRVTPKAMYWLHLPKDLLGNVHTYSLLSFYNFSSTGREGERHHQLYNLCWTTEFSETTDNSALGKWMTTPTPFLAIAGKFHILHLPKERPGWPSRLVLWGCRVHGQIPEWRDCCQGFLGGGFYCNISPFLTTLIFYLLY